MTFVFDYCLVLVATFLVLALLGLTAFRFGTKLAILFAATQTVAGLPYSPLVAIGVPICAILARADAESLQRSVLGHLVYGWPGPFWLWGDDESGIYGPTGPFNRLQAFQWTALRNTVGNFRFLPGVSGLKRPLWYRTFTLFGKQFYAKAGWESDGWQSFSAGGGRGY